MYNGFWKYTSRQGIADDAQYAPPLATSIQTMADRCIDCPACRAECLFLERYGTPKMIAASVHSGKMDIKTAFECHLCGLCGAVCPMDLRPDELFLAMRREAVERGAAPLPAHKRILAYESRGISKRYSWYSLPEKCHTVLFPGCTFSGTRMDTTLAFYKYLKAEDPRTGIVLDCCTKPSHDLGRQDYFTRVFGEMKQWLLAHDIKTIIVLCPNCYNIFKKYGAPLTVKTAYEILAENGLPENALANFPDAGKNLVSIHDPCVLRYAPRIHDAVRQTAVSRGFVLEEMPHGRNRTLCCGEGGGVAHTAPEFSSNWAGLRQKEAKHRRLLTYCAGCAGFLNKKIRTDHILDAIFSPEAVINGKRKVAGAPFTYLNRLRLKRQIQQHDPASITRERDLQPVSAPVNSGTRIFSKTIRILRRKK